METTRRGFFQICASYASLAAIPAIGPMEEKASERRSIGDAKSDLRLEPLEMRICHDLIPLFDRKVDGNVLERIARIRRVIFCDHGLIVPSVRIREQDDLEDNGYLIRVRGNIAGSGCVRPDMRLALNYDEVNGRLPGIVPARDECPSQHSCIWIDGDSTARAERLGYTVLDASSVIVNHLHDVVLGNSAELHTGLATIELLEIAKYDAPWLYKRAEKQVGVDHIHDVLKALLAEHESIRDVVTILEVLTSEQTMRAELSRQVKAVRSVLDKRRLPLIHVVITDDGQNPDVLIGLANHPQLYASPIVVLRARGNSAREYLAQVKSKHVVHPDAVLAEKLYVSYRRCDEIEEEFFEPVAEALARAYGLIERSPWLWAFHTDVI